jgi:hypothetical protein
MKWNALSQSSSRRCDRNRQAPTRGQRRTTPAPTCARPTLSPMPNHDWRALIYLRESERESGRDAIGTLRFGESAAQEPDTLRGYIERAEQLAAEAQDAATRAEAEALIERLRARLTGA